MGPLANVLIIKAVIDEDQVREGLPHFAAIDVPSHWIPNCRCSMLFRLSIILIHASNTKALNGILRSRYTNDYDALWHSHVLNGEAAKCNDLSQFRRALE